MGEEGAGEDARAVVVVLASIGPEHVVVGAILVIVLEEVAGGGSPLDELPLLEFVERIADLARVLRMDGEEKQDVMERVVGHEQGGDDRDRHQ